MTSNKEFSRFSHIVLNVKEYKSSIKFYDIVLPPMGFERLNCTPEFTSYCDGFSKVVLCQVEERFKDRSYHRKAIGLNHIAFYAKSMDEVDHYKQNVLSKNKIPTLYSEKPIGDEDYYSLLFEDPDRMKIEFVYAPEYCNPDCWPSNIESTFDPYK